MGSSQYELAVVGGHILVDVSDAEKLRPFNWRICGQGRHQYARAVMRIGNAWPHVLMHRYLLDLEIGDRRCVDHIDGNGLNNCRSNLRVCGRGENARNRRPTIGRRGYKGVHLQGGAFISRIGDLRKNLGSYVSAVEAAIAYNEAAMAMFGEFANLNQVANEPDVRKLIQGRARLQSQIDEINRELREWPCT